MIPVDPPRQRSVLTTLAPFDAVIAGVARMIAPAADCVALFGAARATFATATCHVRNVVCLLGVQRGW
ncbi:MAG: hypothetical protein ABI085_15150 [Gemmatimonadaceae bacterium]